MRPEHVEYLKRIGFGMAIRDRLEEVCNFYESWLSGSIESIFVSETVSDEGERLVESLWLFLPNLVGEAHNVLTSDEFDIGPLGLAIDRVELKRRDFVPGDPTSRSRLNINYSTGVISGELKASGENCQDLYDLMQTRLIPCLKGPVE